MNNPVPVWVYFMNIFLGYLMNNLVPVGGYLVPVGVYLNKPVPAG